MGLFLLHLSSKVFMQLHSGTQQSTCEHCLHGVYPSTLGLPNYMQKPSSSKLINLLRTYFAPGYFRQVVRNIICQYRTSHVSQNWFHPRYHQAAKCLNSTLRCERLSRSRCLQPPRTASVADCRVHRRIGMLNSGLQGMTQIPCRGIPPHTKAVRWI